MKSRIIILASSFSLLLLVGIGFFVFQWANQPSQANIDNSPPSLQTDVKGTSASLIDLQVSYFSTKIPGDFQIKTKTESKNTSIIGQYLLSKTIPTDPDQIGITIGMIASPDIAEISAVKFRLSQPETYTLEPTPAGYPASAKVFVNKNSYEKGVFWIEGDKYAQVVASGGNDNTPELGQALNAIVFNWQWIQSE